MKALNRSSISRCLVVALTMAASCTLSQDEDRDGSNVSSTAQGIWNGEGVNVAHRLVLGLAKNHGSMLATPISHYWSQN